MKKIIWILGATLSCQLLLAVGLNLAGHRKTGTETDAALLKFDPAEVNKITVADKKSKLQLQEKDGKWLLPDYFSFPADQELIRQKLEKLAHLKQGWPVATTEEAAGRFKVAADNFERHVLLDHGKETVTSFYLGSSPGFRRVYARVNKENAIYSVSYDLFELPVTPEKWINKQYLRLKTEEVETITLPGFTLVRKDAGWTLADLGRKEQIESSSVTALVDRILELPITAVLGTDDKPEYHLDKPVLTLSIKKNKGASRDCRLGKPEKKDHYILKCSDEKYYFKITSWEAKPLVEAGRTGLLKQSAAETKKAPTAPAEKQAPQDNRNPENR